MAPAKSYKTLVSDFQPQAISTENEYRRALKDVDRLVGKERLSGVEEKLLDLLAALVERYEEERDPTPDVLPGQVLAHLIEACQTTHSALDNQRDRRGPSPESSPSISNFPRASFWIRDARLPPRSHVPRECARPARLQANGGRSTVAIATSLTTGVVPGLLLLLFVLFI